jgi:DNA-binding beta-propeller fold protein YncE
MYISDASSRKIVITDLRGTFVRSLGGSGDADGQFNLPVAMALNSKGCLVVADAFSSTVQIFDNKGVFLSKFGKRGDSPGNFQLIKSLAVDSTDNIYVVDGRAHSISIFNQQGELLLVLGGFYAVSENGKLAPGGFSIPIGIDIDSTDKIFIVDQMNTRVQVFQYFSDEYLARSQAH